MGLKMVQGFYSPDYPEQGETITGYMSACNNDYTLCKDFESYVLTAKFVDEGGTEHTIMSNQEFNNKTPFEITYT
jgi:hypothetical protein